MPHLSGCLKLAFDSRPGMIFLRRRLSGMLRHAAVASGLFILPWSNTFISCQNPLSEWLANCKPNGLSFIQNKLRSKCAI